MSNLVTIYTDGSSHILPFWYSTDIYWGGWAFVATLPDGTVIHQDSGASDELKTGGAELAAVENALLWAVEQGCAFRIVADSQYALEVLEGGYSNGKSNQEAVSRIHALVAGPLHKRFKGCAWMKGHQKGESLDVKANALADKLAGEAMRALRDADLDYEEFKEEDAARRAYNKKMKATTR